MNTWILVVVLTNGLKFKTETVAVEYGFKSEEACIKSAEKTISKIAENNKSWPPTPKDFQYVCIKTAA